MTLALSQKSTAGVIALINFLRCPSLDRSARRSRLLRLRGKGPHWARLALLVFAADILLAIVAWIAVDFFLR